MPAVAAVVVGGFQVQTAQAQHPPGQRTGGALLALGFRPFFLGAGLAATLLLAAWLLALRGVVALPTYYDRIGGSAAWHAHEMVFGYVAAVVAGFLLTSVRNWTGVDTAVGGRLAALVALWLAGRIAPLLPGGLPAAAIAAIDLAFVPALGLALAVPLVRRGATRNLVFLPILGLLLAANLLVHGGALGATPGAARAGLLLAVDVVVILIAVIGGRVLPFFTRAALPGASPRSRPAVEALAFATLLVFAALRPFADDPQTGLVLRGVAAAAAAVHALRLLGWVDVRIVSRPLLWILFLGYAWIVIGLALSALRPGSPLALHALTAGAMGSMTLGMMARVSLGHTGRPLAPHPAVTAAFALVTLAAVARVLVPLLAPAHYGALLLASGLLWIAAFGLFSAVYAPILARPRSDGRPG